MWNYRESRRSAVAHPSSLPYAHTPGLFAHTFATTLDYDLFAYHIISFYSSFYPLVAKAARHDRLQWRNINILPLLRATTTVHNYYKVGPRLHAILYLRSTMTTNCPTMQFLTLVYSDRKLYIPINALILICTLRSVGLRRDHTASHRYDLFVHLRSCSGPDPNYRLSRRHLSILL